MRGTRNLSMLALVLALALPALAAAEAATWHVDPAHTGLTFSIRHFFTKVSGRFNDFSGTIVYDPDNPSASSVEFTVQAASINTDNDRRDGHLRSPDFFDVEKFPTLSFKSTGVKAAGGSTLEVTGDLTIHGVTQTVTLPVEYLGSMNVGPMGIRAGFTTELEVDRKEFGLTWNRVLDQGGTLLGDEVAINIDVEAVLEQPQEDEAGE